MASRRDVFINCPFDSGYRPHFDAIVFTISRCGFRPRSALEADDGTENRLTKIIAIIGQCSLAVHDISRTEAGGDPPLPRFNMPLELGLFLGGKAFGDAAARRKRCIIFDREPFRYQRFMSDIAGQDIHAHADDSGALIRQLAAWLRAQTRRTNIPGGQLILGEFAAFEAALPDICADQGLGIDDLTFLDRTRIIASYLAPV